MSRSVIAQWCVYFIFGWTIPYSGRWTLGDQGVEADILTPFTQEPDPGAPSLLSPPLPPPFCHRRFLLKPPFCCLFLMAFLAPCCQSPKWVLTGLWATGEAQRRAFPSLQWSHCGIQQCTNWRRQLSTTNTQVQFAHSSIQITGKWVRPCTHTAHTHIHTALLK